MYLSFPDMSYIKGFYGYYNMPGNGQRRHDVSLFQKENTFITDHDIKFSWHPDGECHFSQDGKIITTVRKQVSTPENYFGHLFTWTAFNLKDFSQTENLKYLSRTSKRQKTLNCNLNLGTTHGINMVGHWYDKDRYYAAMKQNFANGIVGPTLTEKREEENGHTRDIGHFLLSQPATSPFHSKLLDLVVYERTDATQSSFNDYFFFGGFDKPEIALNPNKPTSALYFFYTNNPDSDIDQLSKRLDSRDLQ
ncbi:hypothetical protein Turpa_3461 [Turneriella parva DSM 21527]|uniref:Uncharacterized protein n=2 Tax=Turneriella TaxID=338321 RepID=I4B9Z1_TURPD|nr:hypothetical protein Turpa_3461 [Turneriella parva DSM 21527]